MSESTSNENTSESRPSLTLSDLSLMVQLIDLGSQRGAWQVGELSTVGGLYDRINAFLTMANEAQKPQTNTTVSDQ